MSSPDLSAAATSAPRPSSLDSLVWQTLHMQLERMRAMLYKYSELFYQLITLAFVVLILMTAASLTETLRAVVLLIPFFTIWVGLQSAYYLTYVIFARVYATGIEKRINHLMREDLLIAHRIEAAYLFPLSGPEFAGVTARFGQTFIGFLTLQFFAFGAGVIGLSAYRAWQLLPMLTAEFPIVRFYFPVLGVWALLHLVYLFWYFGTRRYEHQIMKIVTDAYRTNYEQA